MRCRDDFPRMQRLVRTIQQDKEFTRLGWRRGTFLVSYYRGRLQDHIAKGRPGPIRRYRVRHGITGKDMVLNLRLDPGGGDWLVLRGVWVHEDYYHPLVRQARRILDLGANIGIAAVWFQGLNSDAEIACVEADPRNVSLLERNLAENVIAAKIFPCAIATHKGKAQLRIGIDTGISSLTDAGFHDQTKYYDTIQVDARRVPDILDELGWSDVDLLKMDIEGAERDLLADSSDWLPRVGAIVTEVHNNTSPDELATILGAYGWKIERVGIREELTYIARPINGMRARQIFV